MSWLHYLLEANIYLGVFYALYFLLLNKETYYKLNRAYLLFIPVLSYIIPLIQIGWLKSYEEGGQTVTIIYNPNLHQNTGATTTYFTLQNMLVYGYLAGAVVMLAIFTFKICQLIKLTRAQKSLLNNKYKLVNVADTNTAFSFFNYLFIGTNVSGADTMIRHELVHIDQKHSVDIVFLELIKIINWFNPFVYLLQRSVKMVHEYIADEHTAAYENDVLTYSSFLVSNAYGLSGSSISNSFFNYNLLKKRIIMLNQKRSGNLARLKYLAVVPVCGGLLCMSTLAFSKSYGWINILPANNLLSLQTPVTKNPDVLKSKKGDTLIRLKLKLDTGKRIPPPPPPAAPKGSKSDKVTKLNKVLILSPVKSADVKNSPEVLADAKGNVNAQGKQLTNIKIISRDLKEVDVQKPQKTPLTEVQIISQDAQKTPPPMAPFMPPSSEFAELSRYAAKHVRYPTVARANKSVGSVIVKFDVAENHKLSNVILIKGIGSGCDEEVLRVIKGYTGDINTKSGTYKLAITFNLDGLDAPKPATESLANDPSFAGEIVVMGYASK